MKDYHFEMQDLSTAELDRFERWMTQVLIETTERKKNNLEFDRYISNNYATLVTVSKVITALREKPKTLHRPITMMSLLNLEGEYAVEPKEIRKYIDSQGNEKTGVIYLDWNNFISLDLEHPKGDVEFGTFHNTFYIKIYEAIDFGDVALKFTTDCYELFEILTSELGYPISDSLVQSVKNKYQSKFKEASFDPDKLDVLYENLPQIVWDDLTDEQLYIHLDLILDSVSFLQYSPDEALYTIHSYLVGGSLNTSEERAILNILYAIKDRLALYKKLNETDDVLLLRIYNKLKGDECDDLMRFLYKLVEEFDSSKPTETVYFDNSYYLFRGTHLEANWSGKEITINNYKYETKIEGKIERPKWPGDFRSEDVTNLPKGVKSISQEKITFVNKPFKPLAKLNFGTKIGDDELVGDDKTFVLPIKLHNKVFRQRNWDLFDIATDLLSLLSAAGMVRVIAARGISLTTKAIAAATLTKDALHYTMLSQNTLQKWHDNGYGWLANLWLGISIGTDLLSLSLPDLRRIVKEGKTAAELADTVEEAFSIRKTIERVKSAFTQKYSEFLKIQFQVEKVEEEILESLGIFIVEIFDTLFPPLNNSSGLVTVGADFEVLKEGKSVFKGTSEAVKKYIDKIEDLYNKSDYKLSKKERLVEEKLAKLAKEASFLEEGELVIVRRPSETSHTGVHYQMIYYDAKHKNGIYVDLDGGLGDTVVIKTGPNKLNLWDIPVQDRKVIEIKGNIEQAVKKIASQVLNKTYNPEARIDCFQVLERIVNSANSTIPFKGKTNAEKFKNLTSSR